MARPLRLEFPGAIYHVTSRGNDQQPIFVDDEDREFFLETLGKVASRFNWIVHAYCLMDNHFHLVMETLDGKLSVGMRQLNGVYTQNFNRRHSMDGPVVQGRFKAILIERDTFLLEMCRYVVLNPLRLKAARQPQSYKWSSYKATAGLEESPSFLDNTWIHQHFSKQKKRAEQAYQDFVREGIGGDSPWTHVRRQILLGSPDFIAHMEKLLASAGEIKEYQKKQRKAERPALKTLFNGVKDKASRNGAIRKAHIDHGYSLFEIGDFVGLHYATISKIANANDWK